MKTRYILHIGSTDYELQDDDLRNWDEIRCSYKRSSYDGVVRSFTSKFEFVNRAYEILQEVYLRDRFNASAILEVQTMTDRWGFEKVFECPLDFSSIEWENNTLRINAVDNNLAALIKANKSTKYEFAVGSEMPTDNTFNFDRMPMQENVTYGFTQGTTFDNCADIVVSLNPGENIWVGNIGSEISVGGSVYWKEDQTEEANSYILEALKDLELNFEFDYTYREDTGIGWIYLYLRVIRNGSVVTPEVERVSGSSVMGAAIGGMGNLGYSYKGSFTSYQSLYDYCKPGEKMWAKINGVIWVSQYTGHSMPDGLYYRWNNTGKTSEADYFGRRNYGVWKVKLQAGDKLFILGTNGGTASSQKTSARVLESKFIFGWFARGESANIPVMTPKKVGSELLKKIANGKVNTSVYISDFDKRIANTYLLAAESARGIIGAKFYSSFNEFCDWMAAVFGYVYYIGAPAPSKFLPTIQVCGDYEHSPWSFVDEFYANSIDTKNIVYIPQHGRFLYHDTTKGKLYTRWHGSTDYNDANGYARTDTLFIIQELSTTNLYYFEEYTEGVSRYPVLYDYSEEDIGKDGQTVYFVHRSELLNPNAPVKVFDYCRELKYGVDTSVIYSTITAGYDKKDYENINGRDEFNFNNTYTTGCSVSDKTLSLLSKYRADCYGIEFAVQKRGEDTTDTTADKDVFFLLCTKDDEGLLIPDRSLEIKNTISNLVFNGAFSPMACIMANAGYIGLQADNLQLTFASSTGNSDIEIDGVPMTSNLTLNTPIATAGTIEFTTDEVEMIGDENDLIEVVSDGVLYRGFLKEVDIKYAREEAAKYKLIVKDIEP